MNMKRTPFNLVEWIKDRSKKVVVEDGREIRIVNYQFNGYCPVRGFYGNDLDDMQCFNEKELYFEEDEPVDDAVKSLKDVMLAFHNHVGFPGDNSNSATECLDYYVEEILNAAKKVLGPKYEEEIEKAYKNRDEVVYRNGIEEGKKEMVKKMSEYIESLKKEVYSL